MLIWDNYFLQPITNQRIWVSHTRSSEKHVDQKQRATSAGLLPCRFCTTSMPSSRVPTVNSGKSGKGLFPLSLSLEHLAHELNSLLDGSIRSLGLAQRALEDETGDSIATRLDTAQQALQAMSNLLESAMRKPGSGINILRSNRLLEAEISAALEALKPLAQEHNIIFTLNFSEISPNPVAGLLAPVIANGLRNAVESIANKRQKGGRVDVSVNLIQDQLNICITDNGVGLDDEKQSDGTATTSHGIGLELCRALVTSLDGKLSLTNTPDHDGAQLSIHVPLRSLEIA